MISRLVMIFMRELWKHFKIDDYDIRIDESGIQQFEPDERFSYHVYQNYVIHYIESGKGIFIVDDKVYELAANEGFILRQGQHVSYYGDKDDPWKNYWVGFSGKEFNKFINFTSLSSAATLKYQTDSNIVKVIKEVCGYTLQTLDKEMNLFFYQSKIYELLLAMSTEFPSDKQTVLVEQNYDAVAYEYINSNYHKQISVNQIASFIGISRSYLYKLFKESYGISPQEYLIQKRMHRAVDLILHTSKPINVIAKEVGYDDQLHFSKAFRATYGVSPSKFKKTNNVEIYI